MQPAIAALAASATSRTQSFDRADRSSVTRPDPAPISCDLTSMSLDDKLP
jgi:hypothetical protein